MLIAAINCLRWRGRTARRRSDNLEINRRYFSGFTGSNAIILITPDRRMLLTDFRYTIQAKAQSKGVFEVIEVNRAIDTRLLADELRRIGSRSICFYNEKMTVSLYERFVKELGSGLEFKPISAIMSNTHLQGRR